MNSTNTRKFFIDFKQIADYKIDISFLTMPFILYKTLILKLKPYFVWLIIFLVLQIQEWFIKLAIGYIPLPLYTPSKPKQYIFLYNWIFFYDWKNCKNNALLIAKHRFKKVPILPRTAIEFISRYPRTLTIFSFVPTLSSSTT